MPRVYLSLGSNIEPRRHIRAALDALVAHFGAIELSPVYESRSSGFEGDNFLNLVVGLDTGHGVGEVKEIARAIEDSNGRLRDGPRFSSRTLDIDVLLYDDLVGNYAGVQLPRDEILSSAFVLRPLADIVPEARHPEKQSTYARLWERFQATEQDKARALWPVHFQY